MYFVRNDNRAIITKVTGPDNTTLSDYYCTITYSESSQISTLSLTREREVYTPRATIIAIGGPSLIQ